MLRRRLIPRAPVLALMVLSLLLPALSAGAQGADVSQWRLGDPAIEDTFSRNSGQWNVDKRSGPADSGREALSFISGGRLTVRVPEDELFRWTTLKSDDVFKDFYLEVDTTHRDGPTDGMIGVIFRYADADNFYAFVVDSEGHFTVLAYVDGDLDRLVDWTRTDALTIGEGAENRLAVLANGREIGVLANDEELARIQDRNLIEGAIALVAGTNKDGGLEVTFDNFSLWHQPASTPGRKSISRSTPSAAVRPANATDAIVTSDTLNVRSGPGTNYPIAGSLKKGDGVEIVGRSKDSKWAKLSYSDMKEAWASAQYLEISINFPRVAVATAPTPPTPPKQQPEPVSRSVAWLVIENHIGRYITMQVNDMNFRVEGKVGEKAGRYQFELQGLGRYRVAAQLPNGGAHNWDLYVEPTADKCVNRQGCIALGQTFLQTYY